MSNINVLFENLMNYSDVYERPNKIKNRKVESKILKENDDETSENSETLLNLTVELPKDTDELSPDDVKVNVGVMNVTDVPEEEVEEDEAASEEESETEEETETNEGDEPAEGEEAKKVDAEESLVLENKIKNCTGKEDCECESCKSKTEAKNVDTAKDNIRKRVAGKEEGIFGFGKNKNKDKETNSSNKNTEKVPVHSLKVGDTILRNNKQVKIRDIKVKDSASGGSLKDFEITFSDGDTERYSQNRELNAIFESLLHLDNANLSKLITNFVKDNYKNIDKVVITKAVLENAKLTFKGFIKSLDGKKEAVSFTNTGFNPKVLNNTKFMMTLSDNCNLFKCESTKRPFKLIGTLKENRLSFTELQANFKTKLNENRTISISGNYTLNEGLFDGKVKEFVKRELNNIQGPGMKATPSDDGLGFVIDTKDKDALVKDLESRGYKGDNGVYKLERDKQKMVATFKQSNALNSDSPEYRVEFSARKKDVK